ncbi:hypothetical protein [uncultured Marinobacter sp.]|uniref:hypothetical protein n=1 Tax=uncultured Marinobacter sp. TaxID=187379 RepID=UPI0025977394|nr:hypothetical protein [uncultured Marinobacter sp.]
MTENLNWVSLGALSEATSEFSDYSRDIGVYRAILNGKVVYIGKATELSNGGFRKRLRDYTRTSSSARSYPAGQLMHKHKGEIQIEIVLFERSLNSVSGIEALEKKLIKELNPAWNNKK